jgi:ectoine hydroxylase-related dioxygenase (phytanoyl-CoA dioxygenase family)
VTTALVSPAERERYDRDGFLVIESGEWSESLLDGIVDDLEGSYQGKPHLVDGVSYAKQRIQDAWKVNPGVKALALDPKVLAILEELYGRKPLPFQTLNFRLGTQQKVHSDAIHFNSDPPGFMCGVWVALEDMDMDNGPLVYYPGSHKLPEVTMQDLGAPADGTYESYQYYERHVDEQIERHELEPAYATISKGQAFVWSSNILHGGSPRRDENRTRHSQVTHYFFEGCRYYTPLVSDDKNIAWRDPEWVS